MSEVALEPARIESVVVAGPPPTKEPLPSAPLFSTAQEERAERLLAMGRGSRLGENKP